MPAAVRIDVWAWAVRMFKTRTQAAEAVRAGHVKINGEACKPAAQVVPGDTVRIWKDHREWVLEVTQTPAKRVGAPVARQCYLDKSPALPPREIYASVPTRDRGAGRPTKKDRREMEKFRAHRTGA